MTAASEKHPDLLAILSESTRLLRSARRVIDRLDAELYSVEKHHGLCVARKDVELSGLLTAQWRENVIAIDAAEELVSEHVSEAVEAA